MSRIFFTSDLHLSHTNIAGPKVSKWKEGYRDFDTVHDMNKCITQTLNKYVKAEDTLYFLGDFCFGGHQNTPNLRNQINCRTIHVCRGNHDNHIDLYKDSFTTIQDVLTVSHGSHKFFLSHYPHLSWHHASKGVIMLHGHEHGMIDYLNISCRRQDVGIDTAKKLFNEYRPFSIEEVISIAEKKAPLILGHHKGQH